MEAWTMVRDYDILEYVYISQRCRHGVIHVVYPLSTTRLSHGT
jgi:hypothetical protein